MRTESRIVRKFAFSDLTLAYKVRGIMREELIKFDANGNERFEENEIKQAMITILGESENELHYVVKNVFRYDRDNDKMVTYDELVLPLPRRPTSVSNSTSGRWPSSASTAKTNTPREPSAG